MGGFGSGRPRSRSHVEDGLTLDLPKLIRDGLVRPGQWNGSLVWRNITTGQDIGSVRYTATMTPETGEGSIRLTYTVPASTRDRLSVDEDIPLEALPQPFGGQIWYLRCPISNHRCRKLVLPAGAKRFAARQVYRLKYRSQCQAPYERALGQAYKIRHRLGDDGRIDDPVRRPPGMHHRTFQRQMEALHHYEEICGIHLQGLVERLQHLDQPQVPGSS